MHSVLPKEGRVLIAGHNIVKKHQGEIKVTSEVGLGTTVTLEIPKDLKPPQ